jgi:hypothetical protein
LDIDGWTSDIDKWLADDDYGVKHKSHKKKTTPHG